VHILQPDVAFCGGLTVCRQASDLAAKAGRTCVPHCFSTGVNLAAVAALDGLASRRGTGGILPAALAADAPPRAQSAAACGRSCAVPTGPGLGIELDEVLVERYRVKS